MPDIIVSNQAELVAALNNARGGETIKLRAGDYGSVNITNRDFASTVTIVSEDAGNPAAIRRLSISGSSNVALKNLDLSAVPGAAETAIQLNTVYSSKNISFDGVHIQGPMADPRTSITVGMIVKGSSGISVTNSTLDHLGTGLDITDSSDVTIRGNSLSEIRRDGMIMAGLQRVTIDNNLMTDFHPNFEAGDHPDGIQFYTHGRAVSSSDVTITNNVFLQGEGDPSQGIFMGDDVGNLPFQNVTISNNLVYMSGRANAISVGGARNLVVTSNSVLSRSDDSTPAWISLKSISGGTVANNVADSLEASGNSALTIGDNAWLGQNGAAVRGIANVNALANAQISDLLLDRYGFQPAPGTAAYKLWAAEKAAAGKSLAALMGDHMILDLQFSGTGVQDLSHFNSSNTKTAIDPANLQTIGGESRYHVATGKGFELVRANSLQLFDMTAFTLSFDLQRDSGSATTGQVIGIFQSWAVTLMTNGELNFTMRNDAGVTYSLVTKDARITDGKTHEIAITYDQTAQRAVIYVDDVARGSGKVTGSTRRLESWGLYVGNPYGASFSGNIGNIQLRDVALPASQINLNAGSGTVETPPVASNPFLSAPSMASASVASLMDYRQYGLLAHA